VGSIISRLTALDDGREHAGCAIPTKPKIREGCVVAAGSCRGWLSENKMMDGMNFVRLPFARHHGFL
jgi:hypothetical protein